jgi:hypothetical protein
VPLSAAVTQLSAAFHASISVEHRHRDIKMTAPEMRGSFGVNFSKISRSGAEGAFYGLSLTRKQADRAVQRSSFVSAVCRHLQGL